MLGQRDDAACFAIADALRAQPSRLRSINLKANYIGEKGALALAAAVLKNAVLQVLDLSANEIGAAGVQQMSDLIAASPASAASSGGTSVGPCGLRTLRLQANGGALPGGVAIAIREKLSRTRPYLAIEL